MAWGPQANSNGASLELEAKRVDESQFDVRLKTAGMSGGRRFQLVSWPLNQRRPSVIAADVTVSSNGYVTCPIDQKECVEAAPGAQVVLHLRPIPGEPTRLELLSEDHEVKAMVNTNLLPIQGSDRGCDLRATLVAPNGIAVLFRGLGFAPNEVVTEDSTSGHEANTSQKQANSAGQVYSVAFPVVKGETKGELRMTLKSNRCAPTVTVPWSTN